MDGILLKRLLLNAGISIQTVESLKQYLYRMGIKCYQERVAADPELKKIVVEIENYGSLTSHYAYKTDSGDDINTNHIRIQLALGVQALRRRLGVRIRPGERVLDVGDPDGLFLKLVAGGGISVNISEPCVLQVKRRGGKPVRADIESLPFKSAAADHLICFETLEHLENPIKGLKELARVTRKSIFISIPYLERTRILRDNYQVGAPEQENHIFEFSREDFENILTHAKLKVVHYEILNIFPQIRNPIRYGILKTFYFPLMFPKFQFMELARTGE